MILRRNSSSLSDFVFLIIDEGDLDRNSLNSIKATGEEGIDTHRLQGFSQVPASAPELNSLRNFSIVKVLISFYDNNDELVAREFTINPGIDFNL